MIIEAPKLKKAFLKGVEQIVGASHSSRKVDRLNYSRDSNFRASIQARYGKVKHLPDLVVWPSTAEQIQKLVRLAIRFKVPVVPYGAGSGVAGGTVPVKGGMIIDVKRLNQLLRLDEENLSVTVEAGMMGLHLEEALERKGYTLGHFPSSILCASVGGYLAARSAGQESSRYGKIEDMIRNLEMVTGKGELLETRDVANGSGIDLNQILIGSEGTLGLFTKATLRIHPLPEKKLLRGMRFKDMKTAMEAMRRIMQSGMKPAVLRLYDEIDTLMLLSAKISGKRRLFQLPTFLEGVEQGLKAQALKAALTSPWALQSLFKMIPSGCLLIIINSGHERLALEEQKIAIDICKSLDGEDMGEEPARHWLEHRYSVSYNASRLFVSGAFTDTIEVATTWDRMEELYHGMVDAITPHALVMAHLSHVYTDGGSLYFTFVAPLKGPKKTEELFDTIWDEAMKACQDIGGVISHHHGIGKLKAKYMGEEWGDGVLIFEKLKALYDPHGILNPGKLIITEKTTKKGKEAA